MLDGFNFCFKPCQDDGLKYRCVLFDELWCSSECKFTFFDPNSTPNSWCLWNLLRVCLWNLIWSPKNDMLVILAMCPNTSKIMNQKRYLCGQLSCGTMKKQFKFTFFGPNTIPNKYGSYLVISTKIMEVLRVTWHL